MTGSRLAAYIGLGPTQLVRALLQRGVLRVRAPLLTHLRQPTRRRDQPDDPVPQVLDRPRQVGGLQILLDQRVVRHEQAVLQGQVHRGRRLPAPRRRDEDDLRLVHRPQALTVVVLDRVLDRRHPRAVSLHIAQAVQAADDARSRSAENGLDPWQQVTVEVEHRAAARAQDCPDLVADHGSESDRSDRAIRRPVEHLDDPIRLLDRRNERDQPSLEPQLRELDQQRVAHRLRADPRTAGEEEHWRCRHRGGHGTRGCRTSM